MARTTPIPLTKILLTALAATGGVVADYVSFFYDLQRFGSAYGSAAERKRLQRDADVRQALYTLRRRNLIRTKKLGKKLMVELTDTGRRHARALTLRRAPQLPPGTYTLVMFDIPEQVRLARRQFRWFLRQSGFTKLQQSVWVSQRDVLDPLKQLVRQLKLGRWVTVCRATSFSIPPRG